MKRVNQKHTLLVLLASVYLVGQIFTSAGIPDDMHIIRYLTLHMH